MKIQHAPFPGQEKLTAISQSSTVVPDIFDRAVQAEFAGQKLFMGAVLVSAGVVAVSGTMPTPAAGDIGKRIVVPYFGNLGEFTDVADATSPGPSTGSFAMDSETATLFHSAMGFEMSRWAEAAPADPYGEAARQVGQALLRRMDKAIIDAAVDNSSATNPAIILDYSTTGQYAGQQFNWDMLSDAKRDAWADQQEGFVAIAVNSKVFGQLEKLKSSSGTPLLVMGDKDENMSDGVVARFAGLPLAVSDRLPYSGTMSAIAAAGTTPPTLTFDNSSAITGNVPGNVPNRRLNLVVKCTTAGARGTSKISWSFDGGITFSPPTLTAANLSLTEYRSGYVTGVSTGITLNIASGNMATDNVWTANSVDKHTSLLLKRGAMSFWFAQNALGVQPWHDPARDVDLAYVHLYCTATRYRRTPGSVYSGVVQLLHA